LSDNPPKTAQKRPKGAPSKKLMVSSSKANGKDLVQPNTKTLYHIVSFSN
jgi:hypothetical protein